MRPAGEIRLALLQACRELVTPERAPTIREMAARARVGYAVAYSTVDKLRRAEQLCVVRRHREPHCNRWIAQWAPVDVQPVSALDAVPLKSAMRVWG